MIVGVWYDRAVREVPKCKPTAATEETTAEVMQPQPYACTTTATDTAHGSAESPNAEPTQQPASDSEQPATDAPAASVPVDQQTAAATPQKGLAQSSSDAYLHAVIPNLDAIIAENDFSSLDAQKR